MKYQAIKHNKTGTRLLKLCDTLLEAVEVIKSTGAKYVELSYVGGFPVYRDQKGKGYTIQGAHVFDNGQYVVCSLDAKDLDPRVLV